MIKTFGVSERRACCVVEQPRSTQRKSAPLPGDWEQHLRSQLRALAGTNPRYGYRRLHALLVRQGYQVNLKRVQRLCRDEGLRVRIQKRKRSRVGVSTLLGDRQVATHPNHVWALDFQFDQTTDARVLKLLNITDEFTKTALAIEVERSISSDDMVRVLERLVSIHGAPMFLRMDNGTEMTANALRDWCRFTGTAAVFIEPGSPWQNAYVESFNGKIRDELLAIEEFTTLLEAKIMTQDFRQHYNSQRPHSTLKYKTPDEFTLDQQNNNPGLTKILAH